MKRNKQGHVKLQLTILTVLIALHGCSNENRLEQEQKQQIQENTVVANDILSMVNQLQNNSASAPRPSGS